MIRAAIHGKANTPNSRDLVRLLLIHPDLLFTAFVSPDDVGRHIWEDVEDIYGNCDLRYQSVLNLEDIDVLFCLDADNVPVEALNRLDTDPEFRLIVFSPEPGKKSMVEDDPRFVMGVPEFNRKTMVRGARAVYLPTPPAMALLCALFPIAKCLGLPADSKEIEVDVEAPPFDPQKASELSETVLSTIQNSFVGKVRFRPSSEPYHSLRGLTVDTSFPCSFDLSSLREIFSAAYDDHNFTFLLPEDFRLPGGNSDAPLAGCNKCFITIENTSSSESPRTLHVRAALDPRMKGAVGNAIHCMNLLFGLHERTGLYLKPGE